MSVGMDNHRSKLALAVAQWKWISKLSVENVSTVLAIFVSVLNRDHYNMISQYNITI
jgi:hypothetical protein